MKKTGLVFLPVFLFAVLFAAIAAAGPAPKSVSFINGWYRSHAKPSR